MVCCLNIVCIIPNFCLKILIQVLRLFHFLVKFGYYGSEEIKMLLKPLIGLLNGKLDKPFPPDTDKGGMCLISNGVCTMIILQNKIIIIVYRFLC